MFAKVVVCSFGLALFLLTIVNAQKPLVSGSCMGCMCESSTGCNVTQKCVSPTPQGYYCGPFLISYNYWSDAGKPVLQNDDPERKGAFEDCVQDVQCAAVTVTNYMQKYKKDCNNDGKIDCVDFAYIHRLGGFSCRDSSVTKTEYFFRFDRCLKVVRAASIDGHV